MPVKTLKEKESKVKPPATEILGKPRSNSVPTPPAQNGKDLPEGWRWVKLGDVCEIINGKNQKEVINPNGKYPIYGSSGIFGYADKYLCNEGTTIVGRKGNINSPIYVATKFWNVDTAFGLTPKTDIDGKFLFYFCKGFNFHALDKSTTIPSLAKTDLLKIDISIPPLRQQHAIVSKLEELFSELDKGIEQLKTAQQQLKTYRQAVLKWAFEGRLTNKNVKEGELPEGWKLLKLKDVSKVLSGYAFKSSDFVDEGVPVIKIANVGYSEFEWKAQQFLPRVFLIDHENFKILSGDLLIALTRPITNNTTKVCKYPINSEPALLNQRVASIKELKTATDFIFWYFQTDGFKNYIRSKFSETLQPNLSPKDLELTPLAVPSWEEQTQIVQEIESRLSVCDKLEETITTSLAQAETLRQSILKKAFEGRLI